MGAFLQSLNQYQGALNVLFTGVVALSTVVYAALTWNLVRETRLMRRAQTTPKVAVFYRNRNEWIALLDIVVRNVGLGPARDVSFRLASESNGGGGEILLGALKERNLFSSGLRFLAPGQEYSSFFTNTTEKFEEKMSERVRVAVQYRAATGEQYEDEYVIDLSEIRGMVRIGSPPLLDIAKHTDSISKAIAGLLAGNRRIKTDIYTSEDRTTESAEHKAWLEEERRKQQEAGEPDS